MKKFILKTQGCKSNQLESNVIKEKLIKLGFEETTDIVQADYFILNSCSVTENADIEAKRIIRHAKNTNHNLTTIFTGCSAQLNFDKLKQENYADMILGNDEKLKIEDYVLKRESKVDDIFELKGFNNQLIHEYNNTRGYLKIQDGCNNYCSYCTIPYARGNSRSNSIENILEQVKIYTDIGIKEVVLTGIHIGQWGTDFDNEQGLYNLLEKLEDTNIKRYRLGSLNTLEISDELLNFLSKSDKFCPHFHISLQSLCDKTLKAMNRKYNAQSCIELIEKIDEMFNLPFIGSDIIAGFPNENDEDFTQTLENVKKSKLTQIHVFPYSIRKNTVAANMPNQVDENLKHLRAELLKKEAKNKYYNFKNKNLGQVCEVLIEKRADKKTGEIKGVTKNYLTVYLEDKTKNLHNSIQKVKITALNDKNGKIFGKLTM